MISFFLLLAIAYLIHQKMIDWAFSYSNDRSALDELSYREVLVQNIMASIFVYLLVIALYVVVIRINPFIYDGWMHLFNSSANFFTRYK